jgi:biotin-dependent carboxylase-like uncharacterized protein
MLEIVRPGLWDTLQDQGRFGYRGIGVPLSGAMDQEAFSHANRLLRNAPDAAALEVCQNGGVYLFKAPTCFVLCGPATEALLDDQSIATHTVYSAKKGSVLSVRRVINGVYTYVAVKGGFVTDQKLNSRSMHLSLYGIQKLKKGDQLPYQVYEGPNIEADHPPFSKGQQEAVLQAIPGPEFHQLHPSTDFSSLKFTLSDHNRMGYRLLPSVHLKRSTESIRSAAVFPGIVQLTPSGECIVLHRDAQVSGGYPRILILTEQSLNRLAQIKKGEIVVIKCTIDPSFT